MQAEIENRGAGCFRINLLSETREEAMQLTQFANPRFPEIRSVTITDEAVSVSFVLFENL